jgi:hypothetical protein
MDENHIRLRAHQKNVERYRGLLKTKLTDIELHYLERRLSEEQCAIMALQLKCVEPGAYRSPASLSRPESFD